jgi:hypothetical protein
MGQDLSSLLTSEVGQPMAQIFLNSLGKTATLALWSIVVLVQYTMGSSTVSSGVSHKAVLYLINYDTAFGLLSSDLRFFP